MIKAKRIVCSVAFDGMPSIDNFKEENEDIPSLLDNGTTLITTGKIAKYRIVYHFIFRSFSESDLYQR